MRHLSLLAPLVLAAATSWSAEPLTEKLNLLQVIRSGQVEYHINDQMDLHDAPQDIFKIQPDGSLTISGRGHGYMATKQDYRDYHLVLEWKWGEKSWGTREKKARDNGLLLHAYGPHGAYSNTWMASIEAQIIEGGVGDMVVLSPKLQNGHVLQTELSSEYVLDRDREKLWKKGSSRQTVNQGRINWRGRDEDWTDTRGYRGRQEVESAFGEWNRLEVIARGDTLQYYLNGALVNEAADCKPSQGRILLTTNGAEMLVRRYELHPLGQFQEKWTSIQGSGGTDIPVLEGQQQAMSAEESMKQIQLDGPYTVELVAAEPLVLDPVECTWDEQGRLYVADMRDYPFGPKTPGDPWLSRVQLLLDDNADGRMDRAITFADHLDHVQGLLPYDGGLIATTRSEILFLKDTNGDHQADIIRPLIKGFNPRHSQLQVSAPRWGPDGCVHFNNGLDAAEIYGVAGRVQGSENTTSAAAAALKPDPSPASLVSVRRANFKWDPRTGEISPTGGPGQYGGAFDDWGHHFYCSNRNPLMFTVMPYEVMSRNPHAGITENWENIAPFGPETRVYPLKITHTTADAHAGTNTACCGLGVYRGALMPELRNDVFVCDPTGQLITRYKITPNGASLKATRVGEQTEFFRSGDEWSRPVNFTTGPDGAIYICDIYRRWIDHARFFPEEFVNTHDMREGENQGRIWRVVPKGKSKAKHSLISFNKTAEDTPLSQLLRYTDTGSQQDSQHIEARAAALIQSPEDAWVARAVLSTSGQTAGRVLHTVLQHQAFATTYSANRSLTVRSFSKTAAAQADALDFKAAAMLATGPLTWWKPALLQGLAEGLPRSGGKLGVKSLADFLAKPPAEYADLAKEVRSLMAQVESTALDPKAALETQLSALPLLAQSGWQKVQPVLQQLLAPQQKPELQAAAISLLKQFRISDTAPFIYDLLPKVGPVAKGQLVAMLAANTATALDLLKRMERGEVPKALVDLERRWSMQRGTGELPALAKKLFGEASSDRAAVMASYQDSAKKLGDPEKGKTIFMSVCIACHKKDGLGMEVGPPLADVKVKLPEALLSDILDPNRMFEARWSAYQVDTTDGRSLSGLITSETADEVQLTQMGGIKETLSRTAIKSLKSLDRSLMPVGLEAGITPEQMSHLLAYLLGRKG